MKPELIERKYVIHIKPSGKKEWKSLFKCDCGNEFVSFYSHVSNGGTRSCGCFQRKHTSEIHSTHKMSNTRIYKQWASIVKRCENSSTKDYKYYGGRGIKLAEEWRMFIAYYNWAMLNGYSDRLEIDRIDTNKNYEPSNCRFVTREVNTANIRLKSNNTTGYTGISNIPNGKYRCQINVNKININLGCFDSLEQAVIIRNKYIDDNSLPHTKG